MGKKRRRPDDKRAILDCKDDPALLAAALAIPISLPPKPEPVVESEPVVEHEQIEEAEPVVPRKRSRSKKQRCGCASGAVCHVCSRCLEKHCTCGVRKRHRSLCLESRPCNCFLLDPANRCVLCRGCRQNDASSHCRCIQHEEQRIQRTRPSAEDEAKTTEARGDDKCRCFVLSTDVLPPVPNGGASERSMRIRRLRRAIGVPSVENLYQKKVDNSLADVNEAAVEENDAAAESDEDVTSVLHRPMVTHLIHYDPPYQQLQLRNSTSLLESIEPKTAIDRSLPLRFYTSVTTQDVIERAVDNLEYTKERELATPSDSLVDYLVHASSVKAGSVGEMVGTFDDSAAVAAAIVVEEYMKQIVEDLLAANRHVCSLTKASVQAFASQVLKGFNFAHFFQPAPRDALEYAHKWEELVHAIYHELAVVEKLDESSLSASKHAELLEWIRATVTQHESCLYALVKKERDPVVEEYQKLPALVRVMESLVPEKSVAPTPHVRIGVRRNELLGTPSYHFTLMSKLAGDHLVRVSVDNLESEQKAMNKVEEVKKELAVQHRRIWRDVIPVIPALAQQQEAIENLHPTGREILEVPANARRFYDVEDGKSWAQQYAEILKQRAKLRDYLRRLKAFPKDHPRAIEYEAQKLKESEKKKAKNRPRILARREAQRRAREAKRLAVMERKERRQLRRLKRELQQKQSLFNTMTFDESEHPVIESLVEQLLMQVRATRGPPETRTPMAKRKYVRMRKESTGRRMKRSKERPVFGPPTRPIVRRPNRKKRKLQAAEETPTSPSAETSTDAPTPNGDEVSADALSSNGGK